MSEEKYCKYGKMQRWVSYDSGVTWSPLQEFRTGDLIEAYSEDCGYVPTPTPTVIYRWLTVQEHCEDTDLYAYQKRQYSEDDGVTWLDVVPAETQDILIEHDSQQCQPVPPQPTVIYRWVDVSGTCVGYDYHLTQKKQYSEDDGETWQDVIPLETQEVIEYDAAQCYPVPPTPTVYRWAEVSGICVGSDYHITLKKQYSEDGGQTWQDVVPAETREEIEYDAAQCQSPSPYESQYLTFRAREDGTFKFSGSASYNILSYSLDSGITWTTLASNTDSPTIASGNTIMWKGNMRPPYQETKGIGFFYSTGEFDVEGNIMSLLYGDNFIGQTDLTGMNYVFSKLFLNKYKLISAENLVLPATTLSPHCYDSMFHYCTSLTIAPTICATTLAYDCCYYMFYHCTSLTTAPQLPATTLANRCYANMFFMCTSLTTVPSVLPATTLASECYREMFEDCESLEVAPELPATALATYCYYAMFNGCASLTTAPSVLPATRLVNACYSSMFKGCSSLTTAPELYCDYLDNDMCGGMFRYCNNLSSITCYAMFGEAENWVQGVSSTGVFIRPSNSTIPRGTSGIPFGWTIQDYQP